MPLPADFEKCLWAAADQLWTNAALEPSEWATPVLALIFLRYAERRFAVPERARFRALAELSEGADVGGALDEAMLAIEAENEGLRGALPKTYGRLDARTLRELLKVFRAIPEDVEGDVFGRIYEYFLGKFAPRALQKGGEYFTPYSVVRLIVEIVEPYHGRIYDPACGSGGMFVQSARFVAAQKKRPADEISVYGIEKVPQTLRLSRMNLAVHGLSGDIREANAYYEDVHDQVGRFDFVMANPPFNQSAVDKERLKDDRARFPFGMPSADNANYLWIQLFYSALAEDGRAGFVMPNGASDSRGSELEIRRRLVETGAVDVIVSLCANLFYTVTLPVTLWFLDRQKAKGARKGEVLFIDARRVYRQVDRAHRDFLPEQIEFLANVTRLWRGREAETGQGSGELVNPHFPEGKYVDVPGLCRAATVAEIEARGWSLNPGRYVEVAEKGGEASDFRARLRAWNDELTRLNSEARELEDRIAESVAAILGET